MSERDDIAAAIERLRLLVQSWPEANPDQPDYVIDLRALLADHDRVTALYEQFREKYYLHRKAVDDKINCLKQENVRLTKRVSDLEQSIRVVVRKGLVARIEQLEAALRQAKDALMAWLDVVLLIPFEHHPVEHPNGVTYQFHNRALATIDAALADQEED